jgi:hypothetical protein
VLLTSAAGIFAADVPLLTTVPSRDKKIIRRWAMPGDPRGVAVGADGTIFVGLAEPQAVVAIDGDTGAIKKRVVLDSEEIASTKELVAMRTNRERTRLYIANGSDESASILSLPDLAVLREITMEGEVIRDIVPDPKNRYLYVLGRRVHVFDSKGERVLRTLTIEDPQAIAASANGNTLAVLATQDFGNAKATVAVRFDTASFAETAREPLQTEKTASSLMFAANDRTLIALARDALFEKPLASRDIVSSDRICLPEGSGPQIATFTASDTFLVYAERRCSASGAFSGTNRRVTPASLYGVDAYAVAFDPSRNAIVATDRAGFLTLYHVPRAATVQ